METNGDRIERPVRAEVPPRDLQFTHAILLRGSSSQFKLLQFFFFLLNFFKIADCFFQCVEKRLVHFRIRIISMASRVKLM